MSDAIVDEVRKARDEYARRFNYDLQAMCADLRSQQAQGGSPVVSLPKKRVRIGVPRKGKLPVGAASTVEAET